MTSTASGASNERRCDFCDKRGLPILLVRQALADPDCGAPALAAQFQTPGLGTKVPCTARLVRSGYVYVFDEARHRWDGYFVNAQGYFLKFKPGAPMPAATVLASQPCNESGHREIAGCVTVPDAKHATVVWLGFSEVEWTPQVLQKHAAADWRVRHMQKLDVQKWLSSKHADHGLPMEQVAQLVAEYKPAANAKKFGWSPFAWADRRADGDSLIAKANACLKDKGLILAVPDASGLAQEIALSMQAKLDGFIEGVKADKDQSRKLWASSTIQQLRTAVRHQAELDEIDAAQSVHDQAMGEAGAGLIFKSVRDNIDALGQVSAAELERAADESWDRYIEKYDEAGRAGWQSQYDQALDRFTSTVLEPLAQAHVQSLSSPAFQAQMECCFAANDVKTGAAYTAVVNACVKGTAGMKGCFDSYVSALDQNSAADFKNIIMRALVLNHDGIAEAAKNATDIDKRIVPWDNVYGPYKVIVEDFHEGKADEVTKLLYELTGPVAKVVGGMVDGPAKFIIGIMSLHVGKPWVKVSLQGSRKDFRRLVVQQILTMSGEPMNPRTVKAAVDREIRLLEIRGEKLEGRRGAKWLVLLDEQQIHGLPKGTVAQQRDWLSGKLTTPEQLEELQLKNFKGVANASVRMGVVSGILQIVCFSKLIDDDANAMAGDKVESKWRLRAGGVAIAATLIEITGAAVKKLPAFSSTLTRGTLGLLSAERLLLVSRVLGVAGGVIMAFWDSKKAWEEWGKGHVQVAGLYAVSASLGLAVTIGFFFSWCPLVMIVLVGCLVLVAWYLEKKKDNKLQSWLEQCIFGKGERYATSKLELDELNLALK